MIRIITDSTADISPAEAKELGVEIVPLKVLFGNKAYMDGVDITPEDFYELLAKSKELPTTSQPSPEDFLPIFKDAAEKGDSVVAILISAKLSGTLQSATIARDIVEYKDIYVVDSSSTISGLRLLVEQAIILRDTGASAEEIAGQISDMSSRIVLYAIVDTLEYLYKGGRLSRAAKIAGTLLGFKPIITLKNGEIKLVGKARGVKNALASLMDILDNSIESETGVPFYFGYTAVRDRCDMLKDLATEKYSIKQYKIVPVGCTVGAHVGPGACVVTYLGVK